MRSILRLSYSNIQNTHDDPLFKCLLQFLHPNNSEDHDIGKSQCAPDATRKTPNDSSLQTVKSFIGQKIISQEVIESAETILAASGNEFVYDMNKPIAVSSYGHAFIENLAACFSLHILVDHLDWKVQEDLDGVSYHSAKTTLAGIASAFRSLTTKAKGRSSVIISIWSIALSRLLIIAKYMLENWDSSLEPQRISIIQGMPRILNEMMCFGRDIRAFCVINETIARYPIEEIHDQSLSLSILMDLLQVANNLLQMVNTEDFAERLSMKRSEWLEYEADLLRAVFNTIKLSQVHYCGDEIKQGEDLEWPLNNLVMALNQSTQSILLDNRVNRDIVTAAAMCWSVCCTFNRQLRFNNDEDSLDSYIASILTALVSGTDLSLSDIARDRMQSLSSKHSKKYLNWLFQTSLVTRCIVVRAVLCDYPTLFGSETAAMNSSCGDLTNDHKTHIPADNVPTHELGLSADIEKDLANPSYSVLTIFGQISHSMCAHRSPDIRICGLQLVESWIDTLSSVFGAQELPSHRGFIARNLLILRKIVISSWSHPTRQISQLVHTVYQKLVSIGKLTLSNMDTYWKEWIQSALSLNSAGHRSRYQALNVLITSLGASMIVTYSQNIISELLKAMNSRDVAASVTSLIVSLVKVSIAETLSYDWASDIANALLSPDKSLRVNIAEYLLPEILKINLELCGSAIIRAIRLKQRNDASFSTHETRYLWGLSNTCLQSRLINVDCKTSAIHYTNSEGNGLEEDFNLTAKEAYVACANYDDELRLTSLVMLVASNKSSKFPDLRDVNILTDCWKYSLKSGSAEHRKAIVRILKTLFGRIHENVYQLHREYDRLVKSKRSKGIEATNLADEIEKHSLMIEERTKSLRVVFKRLGDDINEGLYPAAPFETELMSLEALRAIVECTNTSHPVFSMISEYFMTESITQTLLTCAATSCWDRSRVIANEILLSLPTPLPGFKTSNAIQQLLDWAMALTNSARQRESESGATILNVIISKYITQLGWNLTLSSDTKELKIFDISASDKHSTDCNELFIELIRSRLAALASQFHFFTHTTDEANQDYSDTNRTSLLNNCHGLLTAIRLHLNHAQGNKAEGIHIRPIDLLELFKTVKDCLRVAMIVVAEAGEQDWILSTGSSSDGFMSVGPASSASITMAASYVNANSTIGSLGLEVSEDIDASNYSQATAQRVVVGAWLLVKESTALLAQIVTMSVVPVFIDKAKGKDQNNDLKDDRQVLLAEKDIAEIGFIILDALGRLKHMGAISETQIALQRIVSCLLQSKNHQLRDLPNIWLALVLAKIGVHMEINDSFQMIGEYKSQRQLFILRRSAGFAYSFLSILRGEVSSNTSGTYQKTSMLSFCLKALLSTVKEGIDEEDKSTLTDDTNELWKRHVHALNVLRLLLHDSNFASEICSDNAGMSLSQTIIYSIVGFKSNRWAVRNSSMMVFTAAVLRAIGSGDKNDNKGLVSRAPSFHDFFSRYPDLYEFLADELRRATLNDTKQMQNTFEYLDPTLYPILLLIGKFRPEIDTYDTIRDINPYDPESYIACYYRCFEHPSIQVRRMAAKAMASTIRIVDIQHHIQTIFDKLMGLRGDSQSNKWNKLHGSLTVLNVLFERFRSMISSDLASSEYSEKAVRDMLALLPKIFDSDMLLFLSKCCICPPIALEWFKFSDLAADFESSYSIENSNILLRYSIDKCLQQFTSNFIERLHRYDRPNNVLLQPLPFEPIMFQHILRRIAFYEYNSIFKDIHFNADEIFERFIRINISEVREGLVRGLLVLFDSSADGRWDLLLNEKYLISLIEAVYIERHVPVLELMLQALIR